MTPAVSVCIPVYNTERFVGDAIRSVLAQTFTDFELVIVDNASTDATPRVIAEFSDPRIRVFRNDENIGAAGNFNRAVSLARGRYLKLLCADDVMYPENLERQVPVLENDAHHELAIVACARDIIDERGKRWMRRRFPGGHGRFDGRTAMEMTVRSGTNVIGEPHAALVRTEAVRAAGCFDARYSYCIDLELWSRLLATGALYVQEDTLAAFRLTRGSWSSRLARRQHAEFARLVDEVSARPGMAVSPLARFSGRMRARVNAVLRQGVTRVVFFNSQT